MKAVVVRRTGAFGLEELAVPEPGPGEVLVRMAVAGLCRTDLKLIEVGHRDLELPRIPGEEVVGTVQSVGAGVPAMNVGRRVYVYPGTSCGECAACGRGAENLCSGMRIMGFHRDGGFAEYVRVPVKSLIVIPDGCSFESAVATEPLSCCLNALELAQLVADDCVGVWGGGPAGAYLARAAAALGAAATVIEPDTRRHGYHAAAVQSAGSLTFDVALVAVGAVEAYRAALASLRPRGRLVVFAGLARADSGQTVDFNDFHYRETSLVGAYGCSHRHGVQALNLIRSGQVRVDDLISHRLPLEELASALDHVRNRTGMKILLYPQAER